MVLPSRPIKEIVLPPWVTRHAKATQTFTSLGDSAVELQSQDDVIKDQRAIINGLTQTVKKQQELLSKKEAKHAKLLKSKDKKLKKRERRIERLKTSLKQQTGRVQSESDSVQQLQMELESKESLIRSHKEEITQLRAELQTLQGSRAGLARKHGHGEGPSRSRPAKRFRIVISDSEDSDVESFNSPSMNEVLEVEEEPSMTLRDGEDNFPRTSSQRGLSPQSEPSESIYTVFALIDGHLRCLSRVTIPEEITQDVNELLRSYKWDKRAVGHCLGQFHRQNQGAKWAKRDGNRASCRRCTNGRRVCVRPLPNRKMVVILPLPRELREGWDPTELSYWKWKEGPQATPTAMWAEESKLNLVAKRHGKSI